MEIVSDLEHILQLFEDRLWQKESLAKKTVQMTGKRHLTTMKSQHLVHNQLEQETTVNLIHILMLTTEPIK